VQQADVVGGFKRFWDNAVPIDQEKDILIDHAHDGIYELDNRLPPWWLYGFYATIVFSVFYIAYYHFSGTDRGQAQEYKTEMREGEAVKRVAQEREEAKINENNVTTATDAKTLESGKTIFIAKCVACHGKGGEGTVGPNLTDEFWLHGGGIKNVFRTVKEGVPAKGMISWKSQLPAGDIRAVSSYILTLKGTNPENPKAPQGEKYVETAETTAPADTAKVKTATSATPK
jgi:cytochrome c oxidase cbb3-type subunit 3